MIIYYKNTNIKYKMSVCKNNYNDKKNQKCSITNIESIVKINNETKYIGIHVLEDLQKQSESFNVTNDNLNKSNELIIKSNKILNLMSWSGWFISLIPFTDYFSKLFTKKTTFDKIDVKTYSTSINSSVNKYNNQNVKLEYENLSNDINISDLNDIEKEELNQIERDIIELSYIGKQIGQQLDLHNNYIDLINEKNQILTGITKKINKKTSDFL